MNKVAYERLFNKLTKENLWMYVIRLLSEKPMYGKEIAEEIRKRFRFNPATITVYVVLYKMEREGLIKRVRLDEEGKVYYEPTELGLQKFSDAKNLLEKIYSELFSTS